MDIETYIENCKVCFGQAPMGFAIVRVNNNEIEYMYSNDIVKEKYYVVYGDAIKPLLINISKESRLEEKVTDYFYDNVRKRMYLIQAYESVAGYISIIFNDATTQYKKQIEDDVELFKLKELRKVVSKDAGIIMWTYDIGTRTLNVIGDNDILINENATNTFYNFPESIIGAGLVSEVSVARLRNIFARICAGSSQEKADIWFRENDNSSCVCERIIITNIRDKYGNIVLTVGIGKNVTLEIDDDIKAKIVEITLKNSNVFVGEYDVVNDYSIQYSTRNYDEPIIVSDFPESMIKNNIIHEDSVEDVREMCRLIKEGVPDVARDIRMHDSNGKDSYIKTTFINIFDVDGNPVKAIINGIDITEHIRIKELYETELQRKVGSEKDLIALCTFDLTDDKVIQYDFMSSLVPCVKTKVGDSIMYTSKQFARVALNYEDYSKLREITDRNRLIRAYKKREELSYEYERISNNGDIIWVKTKIRVINNPENSHLTAFVCTYDINSEKTINQALQAIVNENYDFVGIANRVTGKFTCISHSSNKFVPEMYYNDYDESVKVYAESLKDMFVDDRDYYLASEASLLNNVCEHLNHLRHYSFYIKVYAENSEIKTYKMNYLYVDSSRTKILVSRTEVTAAITTEQRQRAMLSKALISAKKANQAKTEFLARMSHDMRTPLNGILGMNELALKSDDIHKIKEYLEKINISGKILLNLINDSLDMGKIERQEISLVYSKVHVRDFIDSVINSIITSVEEKHIRLNIRYENLKMTYIKADKVRLQQIFINLLSNSVKFTGEYGQIDVVIACHRRVENREYYQVSISDNGIGISEEFLPHLFEPYEQENSHMVGEYMGTGLGMSIVKKLLDLMGATIDVYSRKGKGTKYVVNICLELLPEEEQKDDSDEEIIDITGTRVLIVEDNDINAEIAITMLESEGCVVDRAEDGIRCLEMFNESYDIILMDVMMPGLDGISTTKRIRAFDSEYARNVPIIAMTANAYEEDIRKTADAGMNEHLSKPADSKQLVKTIAKYKNHRLKQFTR